VARLPFVPAFAFLALAFGGKAEAHEFWLSPSTYHPRQGDLVTISMYVGTGFRGEVKPYAKPRTVRFLLRGKNKWNLDSDRDMGPMATNGDPIAARFHESDTYGCLVGYESNFASIELTASEFDAYLRLEGLGGPLAHRARLGRLAGPGRERYARCAKTWIGIDSFRNRSTKPMGLTLEIVPLADPTVTSALRVRVLLRHKPLAATLVRAWNRPLAGARPVDPARRDSVGAAIEVRTDSHGEALLDVRRAGEWLVSTVYMERSAEPVEADWQSWWASLTFGHERQIATAR
jgi:Domain of unknown function (DUF4198)